MPEPDLTESTEEKKAVVLVNECLEIARRYLQPHISMWAETLSNYQSKGYVDDSDSVVVNLNYLRAILERNVARDAAALWPQVPYIPIVARNKEYAPMARAKTKVHSGELYNARFFPKNADCLKIAETYGTAFMEVFWDVWIENIFERELEIDEATGQVVGIGESQYPMVKDGLGLRVVEPWRVGVHPVGNTMEKKEWVTKKTACHVKEIERLIDQKVFTLEDDVKKKDLRVGPENIKEADAWMDQWRRDTGLFNQGDTGGDIGMLVQLWSHDRWITTWNYHITLKDNENENTNMRKSVKPLAMMKCNPHVGPDRFHGQGVWEIIRDLATISNDLLSLFMEKQLQQVARWFVVDPKFVDEENITAEPGGIIKLINDPATHQKGINDVFQVMDMPPIDDELLKLQGIFRDEIMNNRAGQTDISVGVAPSPKQTLGASSMLMEAAQTRLGFSARYIENTYMHDLSYLITKHCDRNMSIPQMVESGGITADEAMMIVSPDPQNIPGGFDYMFDGAERVAHRREKHEKLIEAYNIVGQTTPIIEMPAERIIVKKIIEETEAFDETEMEQMQLEPDQAPPPPPPEELPPEEIEPVGGIVPPNQISTPAQNEAPVAGGV